MVKSCLSNKTNYSKHFRWTWWWLALCVALQVIPCLQREAWCPTQSQYLYLFSVIPPLPIFIRGLYWLHYGIWASSYHIGPSLKVGYVLQILKHLWNSLRRVFLPHKGKNNGSVLRASICLPYPVPHSIFTHLGPIQLCPKFSTACVNYSRAQEQTDTFGHLCTA